MVDFSLSFQIKRHHISFNIVNTDFRTSYKSLVTRRSSLHFHFKYIFIGHF